MITILLTNVTSIKIQVSIYNQFCNLFNAHPVVLLLHVIRASYCLLFIYTFILYLFFLKQWAFISVSNIKEIRIRY